MDIEQIRKEDTYQVWVPITDDLLKSVETDENGDYIVQGVMTSDDKDEEGDNIEPHGMDCSYFLQKGWIKYEHGKNPDQFIGEPLEVKVGQFKHPRQDKLVKGIHVKGRLFAARKLTMQAIEAINDLQKSNTKRCMGWSIEGGVKERCKTTGRIVKSVLRNVVLTMNPVNTMTFAELCKSFAPNHELTIDMADKSMDTGTIAEVMPQSVEGTAPKCKCGKDDCDCKKKRFRSTTKEFITRALASVKLRKSFLTSTCDHRLMAYSFGVHKGLSHSEAEEFASYIAGRQEVIKSILTGGEKMGDVKDGTELTTLLDGDLDAIRKAISGESDEDEDEEGKKKKGEEDDEDADNEGGESDGDADNMGDEGADKAITSDLKKSLETTQKEVFDVSDFLSDLTNEIGMSLDGMEKSIAQSTKKTDVLLKSIGTLLEVAKTQQANIDDLRKSIETMAGQPVGRRSMVSQKDVQTMTKGLDADGGERKIPTRREFMAKLFKGLDAGAIRGDMITRFEGGVPVEKLGLTTDEKQYLGLE